MLVNQSITISPSVKNLNESLNKFNQQKVSFTKITQSKSHISNILFKYYITFMKTTPNQHETFISTNH